MSYFNQDLYGGWAGAPTFDDASPGLGPSEATSASMIEAQMAAKYAPTPLERARAKAYLKRWRTINPAGYAKASRGKKKFMQDKYGRRAIRTNPAYKSIVWEAWNRFPRDDVGNASVYFGDISLTQDQVTALQTGARARGASAFLNFAKGLRRGLPDETKLAMARAGLNVSQIAGYLWRSAADKPTAAAAEAVGAAVPSSPEGRTMINHAISQLTAVLNTGQFLGDVDVPPGFLAQPAQSLASRVSSWLMPARR